MSGMSIREVQWNSYVAADGINLPFRDGAFDLVFSNAVIEHVGGEAAQRSFVAEHERVGQHWIITTPNRLFPVEAHTHVIFRHMKRSWNDPRSAPTVSRLLSRQDFESLLPRGNVSGWLGPTLLAASDTRR
jgi:ubiquinone/menaquinone biosynthesis C-methylase UbiE